MILKGNQRGGAKDLALHLMKDENEHVEIYQLRGFASQNLMGALNEAYAVSRGTRCKQFLFSLSLNPPQQEIVKTEVFEAAIDRIEAELGLTGQPRAIVFHEKEGRRHAHTVWSRIDTDEMKAVQLSFTHKKLQSISRDLYLEHGWKMPRGLAASKERDPRNFTLAEWQHAKRVGKDPREIKAAIQDAWAAFTHALEERGYRIAQGDRRGFVAVDHDGEVYSIPRYTDVKTKAVRERLGDETSLPSVAEVKAQIARDMLATMGRFKGEQDRRFEDRITGLERRRESLVQRQGMERKLLYSKIEKRHVEESLIRQARFRTGLKGLWDRLRGEHGRIRKFNEQDAATAQIRDRAEKDALIFKHLEQRQQFQRLRGALTERHTGRVHEMDDDIQRYGEMEKSALEMQRDAFFKAAKQRQEQPETDRPTRRARKAATKRNVDQTDGADSQKPARYRRDRTPER